MTPNLESMVTEKPILFSGAMVRAILEGRKTQTRRVVKPQPRPCDHKINEEHEGHPIPTEFFMMDAGDWACATCGNGMRMIRNDAVGIRCPYGKPGDRLWVRETWRPWGWREDDPITVQYAADNSTRQTNPSRTDDNYEAWYERIAIQATEECEAAKCERDAAGNYFWNGNDCPIKWRPSIFLPRWASRLTLEIAKVRVERVQDISAEDCLAEGIEVSANSSEGEWTARKKFQELWDSINGNRKLKTDEGEVEIPGASWAANPWVWAIEFQRSDR